MTIAGFKTTLGYAPSQGSRALPFTLKFATLNVTQITQDFFMEQSQGELEFIQSVYIDNSLNPQAVSIRFNGLQQVITVKNQTQGYYPLFVPNGRTSFTALTNAGSTDVPMIFSDVFINPSVWSVV